MFEQELFGLGVVHGFVAADVVKPAAFLKKTRCGSSKWTSLLSEIVSPLLRSDALSDDLVGQTVARLCRPSCIAAGWG